MLARTFVCLFTLAGIMTGSFAHAGIKMPKKKTPQELRADYLTRLQVQ
jgi:hypothetical protein